MSGKWYLAVLLGLTLSPFPTAAGTTSDGAATYRQCAACHMSNGAGTPGIAPPLRKRFNAVATTTKGREYLILVVDKGLTGALTVEGRRYNGFMLGSGRARDHAGIATLLNYLVNDLDGAKTAGFRPFSAKEVSEVRKRHAGQTPKGIYAMRQQIPQLAAGR